MEEVQRLAFFIEGNAIDQKVGGDLIKYQTYGTVMLGSPTTGGTHSREASESSSYVKKIWSTC